MEAISYMLESFISILFLLSITLPFIHLLNAQKVEKTCPIHNYQKGRTQKGFSILVPCYNEALILETTLQGLKKLKYDNYEVIFINDGSTDHTSDKLCEILATRIINKAHFAEKIPSNKINTVSKSTKYPNMYVLDKKNGGKADALNAGINFSKKEFVITLDADSILDVQALQIVNEHFQDPALFAAGGTVKVLQSKKENSNVRTHLSAPFIVKSQIFEYLKGFYIYKRSLAKFKSLTVISGAFGIFKKEILIELQGFRETLGEDIDITVRIQKMIVHSAVGRVKHIPEALCYTECPEQWSDLLKQRVRWQNAFLDCISNHARFMMKNFFKSPLSFFFIVDAFLIGTLSLFAIFSKFFIDMIAYGFQLEYLIHTILIYFSLTLVSQIIYVILTLRVTRKFGIIFTNKLELTKTILLDIFVFKFITTFFVMWGSIMYLFSKQNWNKVERTGRDYFDSATDNSHP